MQHAKTATGSGTVLARHHLVILILMVVAFVLPTLVAAQNFDGARFLDQCLRLEAGQDYVSARESCLNALELSPNDADTLLALARLEIRLDELSSAENRLLQLRARVATAEPAILLAEIALLRNDLVLAESYLDGARQQLASSPNAELSARHAYLQGRTLEQRAELQEALGEYRRAAGSQPLELDYYKAAARVLLAMGLPEPAAEELQQYRSASGQRGDAELHSLRGEALWAAGQLEAAAAEYESAFALRAGRDAEAQASDLRSLSAIYYGMGDLPGGNAALADAFRQGNLVRLLAGNSLMWLLVLLLLAGLHLVSESRVYQHQSAEASEGPRLWHIGRVYSVLISAALLGIVAVIAWSILVLQNYTALFTPLQAAEVKAMFLITFTVIAVGGSFIAARRHGWKPAEKLLGSGEQVVPGLLLGLLLLLLAILWLRFVPVGFLNTPWHFNLNRLSGLSLAALALLPLSELYFRSFAVPAFEKRYGANTAVFLAAALYALILGTPVVLSLVIGVILGVGFLRNRSGFYVVTAQLVLQLGLVLLQIVWSGLVPVIN